MKVTKADLVAAVQNRLEISEKRSEEVVAVMLASITAALARGEEVRIAHFGKFFVKQTGARTYHAPGSALTTERGPHNAVRFTAYARLNEKVAAVGGDELEQLTLGAVTGERRQFNRARLPDIGSAIVRISGIPVCEFKIKDIAASGSALWVEEDSVMLRNIQVGQEIDIRINHHEPAHGPVMQRARIVHISRSDHPERSGFYVIGVQVLGKLPM